MGRARGHVRITPHSHSVTRPHRVKGRHATSLLNLNSILTSHISLLLGQALTLGNRGKIEGGEREQQSWGCGNFFFFFLVPKISCIIILLNIIFTRAHTHTHNDRKSQSKAWSCWWGCFPASPSCSGRYNENMAPARHWEAHHSVWPVSCLLSSSDLDDSPWCSQKKSVF